jgi:hypothetical protein
MTAMMAHGTPVLAETAWYRDLAATRRRAELIKLRVSFAFA